MKVVAACGNGMGSSLIVRRKIETVFQKLGIQADISHCSIGEAKSSCTNVDVIFCSQSLIGNFDGINQKQTKIIGLKNLLSEAEITEKVRENLL